MPKHDPVPRKRGATATDAPPPSRVRYTTTGRAKRCYSPGTRHWSDATDEAFLEALASSANVKWAAKQVGFSPGAAFYQKRIRADFASKWDIALEQAYCTLEFDLVRSAIDTMEGIEIAGDARVPQMTVDQAMRMLWLYRGSKAAGKPMGPSAKARELDELRDSIMKKVRAIRNAPKQA